MTLPSRVDNGGNLLPIAKHFQTTPIRMQSSLNDNNDDDNGNSNSNTADDNTNNNTINDNVMNDDSNTIITMATTASKKHAGLLSSSSSSLPHHPFGGGGGGGDATKASSPSSSSPPQQQQQRLSTIRPPAIPKPTKFFQATPIDMNDDTSKNNSNGRRNSILLSSSSMLDSSQRSLNDASSSNSRGRRYSENSQGMMSDLSERSRTSLRDTMFRLRRSLTRSESQFLQELVQHGNEVDVMTAYETLLDDELFFDYPIDDADKQQEEESNILHFQSTDVQIGTSSNTNHGGGGAYDDDDYCYQKNMMDQSDTTTTTLNTNVPTIPVMDTSQRSQSSLAVVGSERRQSSLLERKYNDMVSKKMWKAHESGLAISALASRRSVDFRRESSIDRSNNSTSRSRRQDRFSISRVESIFRMPHHPLSSPTSSSSIAMKQHQLRMMEDTRSDNNRYGRSRSLHSNQNNNNIRGIMTSSNKMVPMLRRLNSETNIGSKGNSKSVTFASVGRRPSTGSATKGGRSVSEGTPDHHNLNKCRTPPPPPVREDSELSKGSIPSLHLANHILSPTGSTISVKSGTSIPSIHLANQIMSPSGSTYSTGNHHFPSIKKSHLLMSEASERTIESLTETDFDLDHSHRRRIIAEEKKIDDYSHNNRIPLKVEIPSFSKKQHPKTKMIEDATKVLSDLPITARDDDDDDEIQRPVLVRRTTNDQPPEEGIEVADWEIEKQNSPNGFMINNDLTDDDDNNNNNKNNIILSSTSSPTNFATSLIGSNGTSSSSCYDNITNNNSLEEFDFVGGSNAIRTWFLTNSFDDSHYNGGGGSISVLNGNEKDICGVVNKKNTNYKSIFRGIIRRSLSGGDTVNVPVSSSSLRNNNYNNNNFLMDESYNSYIGSGRVIYHNKDNDNSFGDGAILTEPSWKMDEEDDDDNNNNEYDAWKVIEDEYANGYGGGGTLPFVILGTSADDVDAHPHVLSPPLMESLLSFVPYSVSGDNFWLKYSLVRDGASIHSFLQHARGAKYTFLAIETIDGEVFGSFTSMPWRKSWNHFGTGESFLWKMKKPRRGNKIHSIIDQAQLESEIEVYNYTGANHCIQLCTHERIAVGGGTGLTNPASSEQQFVPGLASSSSSMNVPFSSKNTDDRIATKTTLVLSDAAKSHEWGYGLTIESDFLHGTTSPCFTFGSPSLSTIHADGTVFEIMNLELWTLTPCTRLEDAEKLELSKLFLEKQT